MEQIFKTISLNNGTKPIFSAIYRIDWYDGCISALFKLDYSENWMAAALAYFHPNKKIRIFILIDVSPHWVEHFKLLDEYESQKQKIKEALEGYNGKAYLLKGVRLEDINYQVVELPPGEKLIYFDSIEDVLENENPISQKWLNLF